MGTGKDLRRRKHMSWIMDWYPCLPNSVFSATSESECYLYAIILHIKFTHCNSYTVMCYKQKFLILKWFND